MTQDQVERLLNTACEILIELEWAADDGQTERINALFEEIRHSDDLDAEMEEGAEP